MKKILILIGIIIINLHPLNAQQPILWQSLPIDFNDNFSNTPGPYVMCYDSSKDVSYIGGTFRKIGDSVCNVVAWDGSGYMLLPKAPMDWIIDMKMYDGKLYVCGSHQYGSLGGFACWDGQSWTDLVAGDSTFVGGDCMLPYKGGLLLSAGFHYERFNGIWVGLRPSLSFWNGDSLRDLYRVDTLIGTSGWSIKSMAYYKGDLYIAGNINVDTPITINEIARFNGTKWEDVGNFQDGDLDALRKLLIWKDTLYVAGDFSEINGSPGNGIAKWDGSHWHKLNNGVWQTGEPGVTDMMIFNNELYITGWFNIVDGIDQGGTAYISTGFAKWDGNRWCTLGTRADNVIFTMGQFRDSLYIMGAFDSLNSQPMWHMAKWIGGDYTDTCSAPDTTTGIGQHPVIAGNALSIFPNPATGFLNISFRCTAPIEKSAEIVVTDIIGRIVRSQTVRLKSGENNYRLNVSKLAQGMYFLKIKNNRFANAVKFVKR